MMKKKNFNMKISEMELKKGEAELIDNVFFKRSFALRDRALGNWLSPVSIGKVFCLNIPAQLRSPASQLSCEYRGGSAAVDSCDLGSFC